MNMFLTWHKMGELFATRYTTAAAALSGYYICEEDDAIDYIHIRNYK